MTIAVGFTGRDSVLLCADTELQGWASTIHSSKVGTFEFPHGKLAYAYSGNVPFALAAVQKCARVLQDEDLELDPIERIDCTLDEQYRRHVLNHPSQGSDQSLHYQLLLAIHLNGNDKPRLFSTHLTSLVEVSSYEAIGIGEALAHRLIRPTFALGSQSRDLLMLAASTLAMIKGYVPGCGGASTFLVMHKDGSTRLSSSELSGVPHELDEYANLHMFLSDLLLRQMANPEATEAHVAQYLSETFTPAILKRKREWVELRERRMRLFAAANPQHEPFDTAEISWLDPSEIPIRLSTIGDSKPQPPLRETPGGSDES